MPQASDLLDNQFAASLSAELACCERVLEHARVLQELLGERRETHDELERVRILLDEIEQIRESGASIRAQWTAAGRTPRTDIAATVQALRTILPELIDRIKHAEECAAASRNRLVPELSNNARSNRMLKAYGNSLNDR